MTDANLALGRLLPSFFPRIFGSSEDQPLSSEDALREFRLLTATVNHFLSTQPGASHSEMSVEEVAMGFIRVANEAMCRPIRALTQVGGVFHSQGGNEGYKWNTSVSAVSVMVYHSSYLNLTISCFKLRGENKQ